MATRKKVQPDAPSSSNASTAATIRIQSLSVSFSGDAAEAQRVVRKIGAVLRDAFGGGGTPAEVVDEPQAETRGGRC